MKHKKLIAGVMSLLMMTSVMPIQNIGVPFFSNEIVADAAETGVTFDKWLLQGAIEYFEPLHIKMADSMPSKANFRIWLNSDDSVEAGCDYNTNTMYIAPTVKGNTIYAPEDCSNLFGGVEGCQRIKDISLDKLNTSKVTDMSYMFEGCESLTSLDISNFDTSNVTDMPFMFFDCKSLTSLDVSSFDTHNVTNMSGMFRLCKKLKDIDLSGWDTSNVTTMSAMFSDCHSLEKLDLSHFNTSNVGNMLDMFGNCKALKSVNVSNFDTSKVYSIGGMFENCESLVSLDLSSFNLVNARNLSKMFSNCKSLRILDISNIDAMYDYYFSSIKYDLDKTFENCTELRTISVGYKIEDLIKESLTNSSIDLSKIDFDKRVNLVRTDSDILPDVVLDEKAVAFDNLEHATVSKVEWYELNNEDKPAYKQTGKAARGGSRIVAQITLNADDGYSFSNNPYIVARNAEDAKIEVSDEIRPKTAVITIRYDVPIDYTNEIDLFSTKSQVRGGDILDGSIIVPDNLKHAKTECMGWWLVNEDETLGEEITGGTANAGTKVAVSLQLEANDGYFFTDNTKAEAEYGEVLMKLLWTEGTSKLMSVAIIFDVEQGTGTLKVQMPKVKVGDNILDCAKQIHTTINGKTDDTFALTVFENGKMIGIAGADKGSIIGGDLLAKSKIKDGSVYEFRIANANSNYTFTDADVFASNAEDCDDFVFNGTIAVGTYDFSLKGDVNNDGKINISDAVLLQKWLLNSSDAELPNWRTADMNKDNILNSADMSLVREKIINIVRDITEL